MGDGCGLGSQAITHGGSQLAQSQCLLGNQAKKNPNQQLYSLPSSVNPIAFNFFRCLCLVPVLPSSGFKPLVLHSHWAAGAGGEAASSRCSRIWRFWGGDMSSPPLIPLQRWSHQ